MTIVVAAVAPDGIVLGSDSRTTVTRGRRYRVASDNARKVFAPCDAIGLATFGSALIGDRTIAGLVEEFFAQRLAGAGTLIESVSEDLASFFGDAFARLVPADVNPPEGVLGFLVAGYDAQGVGRIMEILLPPHRGKPAVTEHEVSTRSPGLIYRGRTRHIRRMIEGYDRAALAEDEVKVGPKLDATLGRMGYIFPAPLSLQDAIDMMAFIVRLTIDMERLTDGTYARPGDIPVCGGELQSLVVMRNRTMWIKEPTLAIRAGGMSEQRPN